MLFGGIIGLAADRMLFGPSVVGSFGRGVRFSGRRTGRLDFYRGWERDMFRHCIECYHGIVFYFINYVCTCFVILKRLHI